MTPIQEAYALMQEQPESNIKLIVELLRTMSPYKEEIRTETAARTFKRTGLAKETIHLPEDFDEHFSDADKEILGNWNQTCEVS